MKRILSLVVIAGAGGLTLLGTALISPASAGSGSLCKTTITTNTVLTGNVSCSGRNSGITLANGVTLDCNKFSILGDPAAKGEGPGITVTQNSTVRNCTVKYFDAGIYLQPGGNNIITMNTLQDNVGTGNYGDGIAADTSSNNQITANTVSGNGPYDGIGLVGKSNNNLIQYNSVTGNNAPNGGGQDDGIRIEGPGAQNNRVQYNTVSGNGLDGIAVFGNQGTAFNNTGTIINGNTVSGNGFNGVTRPGHGIVLFLSGNQTKVTNNSVIGNAGNGIRVGSLSNTITGNVAKGNTSTDLFDSNVACDANAWHQNTYGTAQPACAGAA